MALMLAAMFFACQKNEPEPEDFCSFANVENIDKTIPFVNQFLGGLSAGLSDEQQLGELVAWLKAQPCITDATLISGDPRQVHIWFEESGETKRFFMDVSMEKPLKITGFHEYEEPEDDFVGITMTVKGSPSSDENGQFGRLDLVIAGTGSMTIDWGDGTIYTVVLRPLLFDVTYSHQYSDTTVTYTVTLKGKDIRMILCRRYSWSWDEANGYITSLDVSKNPGLIYLSVASSRLTSLDLSKNTALEYLDLSGNRLTSLDLSKNTALEEWLDLRSNRLTSLDVSNNPALKVLLVDGNRLTSLDVSNNTALERLLVNANRLTSLDVSNNSALWHLGLANNQLTNLDLSNNSILDWVSIRNNLFSTESLNNLYYTLNSNQRLGKIINVGGNPGAPYADLTIAANKRWDVNRN